MKRYQHLPVITNPNVTTQALACYRWRALSQKMGSVNLLGVKSATPGQAAWRLAPHIGAS